MIMDFQNAFSVTNLVARGLLPTNTDPQLFIYIGLRKSLFVTFAPSPYSQLLPVQKLGVFLHTAD